MPKIRVSLLTLALIPIVMLDPSGEVAATVISAFLHELGHLCVLFLCDIGIKELGVTPYGLEIATTRKYKSFSEEIAVNCAGCAINFITYFAFSPYGGFALSLANASLILGILNSLPVISLDGGEVLHAILSLVFSFHTAEKASRIISFFTLTVLWILAVYIFLFSGYNYSLFIMSVWLFGKIYCTRS